MNPDLVKAARAVLEAQQKYPDLTNAEADKIVQSHTGGKYNADDAAKLITSLRSDGGNAVASGLGGFFGNLADEIVGKLPQMLGGGDTEEEKMRLRAELFKQDHPVGDAAVGLVGGVAAAATGGKLLSMAPKIAALLPEIKVGGRVLTAAAKAATAGGIYGGVSGAGAGETGAERLTGGLTGAGLGAVMGGSLGAAGARISRAINPVVTGKVAHALENTSYDNVNPIGQTTKLKGIDAAKAIVSDWERSGRGGDMVAGDISPHTQAALQHATQNNLDTNVAAKELLRPRGVDSSRRLLTKSTDLIGEQDAGAIDQLLKESKYNWADKAYSDLRNSDATFTPSDAGPFMNKPQIQSALATARTAGDLLDNSEMANILKRLEAGDRSPEVMKAAQELVNLKPAARVRAAEEMTKRPVSFTDMQALKRALDGKVGEAYAKGNVPLAEAYRTIRDGVRSAIVAKLPEYGAVDAEYAGRTHLEDMLSKGVDAWHVDDPSLPKKFAAMSPESQEFLQKGLASQLQKDLRTAETSTAMAKHLTEGSKSMQEKLEIIFGNKNKLAQMVDAAAKERTMARTLATSGGSITNLMGADRGVDPVAAIPSIVHSGLVRTALDKMTRGYASRRISDNAAKTGDFMLTQGAPKIRGLLDDITAKLHAPLLSGRTAALMGTGVSGVNRMAALLFPPEQQ